MQKPKNHSTTQSKSLIKITSSIFSILFIVTLLSAFALLNVRVSAEDALPSASSSATTSVYVNTACSLAATNTSHSGTLTPGNFTGDIGTSNFTATCNDPNGYAIYAVGYSNDEWKNTNLIGAGGIGNITTEPDSGHKTSGDTSYWYMKLASGTAATTVGGATIVSPYHDYASIPSDYTKVATASSTTDGTTGTSFTSTYGAYIAPAQTPGTYVGKVRYTLINPNNAPIYIQDLTLSQCSNLASNENLTVYDKRDGNDYTVRYINGECWMTQNLRITGTISAEYSNFTGDDFNVSEYSLDSSDTTYINHCDATNGYNYACSKTSNDTIVGAWYNYYATTAGTISGNSNTNPATSDICPSGWRLPTGPNTTEGTGFQTLLGDSTPNHHIPSNDLTIFDAATGGYYQDGNLANADHGYWWSATSTVHAAGRFNLGYSANDGRFIGNGSRQRIVGYFIRCVRSS